MKQEIIHIDLDGVNCYLGKSEEGYILFDTGGHITMDKVFTNRRKELVDRLEQEGVRPGNLKAIILTHGDSDHTGNAAFLRDRYHSVIAMHKDDADMVEDLSLEKMMKSFQFRSVIYKIGFLLIKNKIKDITERDLKEFEQFKPDVLLKEGDDLSGYGIKAKVIQLPGHTLGSIGVLCENGELIAGDIFANIKKPTLAPNAADFGMLKASVNKLRSRKLTTIYPGHGQPFSAVQSGMVK
jgi:glyoxylase-like metal-dependent hydrolase (beta-lactamase superfamily II)